MSYHVQELTKIIDALVEMKARCQTAGQRFHDKSGRVNSDLIPTSTGHTDRTFLQLGF